MSNRLCAAAVLALCPTASKAVCSPPLAALTIANGVTQNVAPQETTDPANFRLKDPSQPGVLSASDLAAAMRPGKAVTVYAPSINIDAQVDLRTHGGRLNLTTDPGSGGGEGPIYFLGAVLQADTAQLYLSARSIDQCGSGAAVDGGHLALNAYLGGVGLQSDVHELVVRNLRGFSIFTRGWGVPATIAATGRFRLEEFDRGLPDAQNSIYVHGPLQIERNPN